MWKEPILTRRLCRRRKISVHGVLACSTRNFFYVYCPYFIAQSVQLIHLVLSAKRPQEWFLCLASTLIDKEVYVKSFILVACMWLISWPTPWNILQIWQRGHVIVDIIIVIYISILSKFLGLHYTKRHFSQIAWEVFFFFFKPSYGTPFILTVIWH